MRRRRPEAGDSVMVAEAPQQAGDRHGAHGGSCFHCVAAMKSQARPIISILRHGRPLKDFPPRQQLGTPLQLRVSGLLR